MFPKKMPPNCEALVFVLSAAQLPHQKNDLSSPSKLEFGVYYPDEEGNFTNEKQELQGIVSHHNEHFNALTNGHQTMVIATCYLDQPGWTVRYNFSTYPQDSWGAIVPQIKTIVQQLGTELGIKLDCASKITVDPLERVAIMRAGEDRALDLRLTHLHGAEGAAPVTKLRLDVGWELYKPEDDEEVEDCAMEFSVMFYNDQGEVVQTAGSNEREAAGVVVGREEEEEEEKEEEPEPEEEEGEGEEGEDGEEKPVKVKPEKPYNPFEFYQKDVVFITLAELPPEVRSMVVVVANYAGGGLANMKQVQLRVVDISAGEETAKHLIHYTVRSREGKDKAISQILMAKLYKEYHHSAFVIWRSAETPTLEMFVDTCDKAAALRTYLAAVKEQAAAVEAAMKAAEEEGEEPKIDHLRPYEWRYRTLGLLVPGDSLEAEEAAYDLKNVLNYDGRISVGVPRTASAARSWFAYQDKEENNKVDYYFGGYSEDNKHHKGIYCFASGAGYIGEYKAGKRHGNGFMLMPDGSTYEGEFQADKFHGQGQYRYIDGSCYTGSWKAGKKDGEGIYWDKEGGCLRGVWAKGVLKGEVKYDQPAYHYEGTFLKGLPCGPCTYTVTSHRTLDMDKFAAAFVIDDAGPTLVAEGKYAVPAAAEEKARKEEEAAAAAEGAEEAAEEGGAKEEEDGEGAMPKFPNYAGLGFDVEVLPGRAADTFFPPTDSLPPGGLASKELVKFNIEAGLVRDVYV